MKLGFSTNAFTEKSLLYAIEAISTIGYCGIEIVLDVPHLFLPITKYTLTTLKNAKKKHEIEITNLNSNTVVGWYGQNNNIEKFEPSLSNNNDKFRQWRINYTKKAIDLARELNASSVSITSGLKVSSLKIKNFKKLCNSLEEIATYAEKNDVLIAIEYEPGLLVENSNDVLQLISNNFKNVGVNFDLCHAAVLDENISQVIKKIGNKLYHTHISDCKNKKHYHLIPGRGDIDFIAFIRALKAINYKGFLTGELYPYFKNPEFAAKKTFFYLEKLVS